uniref:Uncharacterized protein n=1 Tax=Arundo donax TaxID=35708 RepID=A0A0A9FJH8_ARUDO
MDKMGLHIYRLSNRSLFGSKHQQPLTDNSSNL